MCRSFQFIFLFLFISFSSFSQINKDIQQKTIDIVKLFESDMYVAVEAEVDDIFSNYSNLPLHYQCELDAYKLMSAILLCRPNIEGLIADYFVKYPNTEWKPLIEYYLSCYYFDIENFHKSLDIMNMMEFSSLPRDKMLQFLYNRSYSNMRVGNNSKALLGFDKIISLGKTKYLSSAIYYSAYIHYLSKDFKQAIQFFSRIEEDDTYTKVSKYFKCESYFMLKNYQYVISEGVKDYLLLEGEYKTRLARIISESFYSMDKSKEAKKYFDLYSNSNSNLSKKDIYYSGIVSYSLGSYRSAIDAFQKVVGKSDSLGQSAYLYLGNSYLQVKNKFEAMSAFKSASECGFDISAKDDALFQYAKLSFDLNGDISVFNTYLNRFPSSSRSDEIYYYIATAYLLNKDYKQAIDAMLKVNHLSPKMTANLQKATFFRAIELFERGAYKSAITNLTLSMNNSTNNSLFLLAKYWLAECYYRIDNFQESIIILTNLLNNSDFKSFKEYPTSIYNLAYSYFKHEDYDKAKYYFNDYLSLSNIKKTYFLEARIRVADCHYMMKDYAIAAEKFDEISNLSSNLDPIYASYMGAISYGLIPNLDKKIDILEKVVRDNTNSSLYTNAMYELGRTYIQANESQLGEKCFMALINNPPDSVFYGRSLIELGMIHSNVGEYTPAINYFRQVVENAPFSDDAKNALSCMETVYQIQNKPEEYLSYLDEIGLSSSKTTSEKELMLFNSAEQLFLSGKYSQAINSLKAFLHAYPNGAKSDQANFYLGETLKKLGKIEAAASAFFTVMQKGGSSFSELSTLNYADISYKLEKYNDAIKAYETLYEVAKLPNNKIEALYGAMNSYFANREYENAISKAMTVLSFDKIPEDRIIRTKYVIVKSNIYLGKRASEVSFIKELANNSLSEVGAECAYLLIEDTFDAGDFDKVENMVYNLSDSKTSQLYWLAKSFIILGDSFAERDDWEQAKATYQSIKDEYKPKDKRDDVIEQVNMRLEKIPKKNEKK